MQIFLANLKSEISEYKRNPSSSKHFPLTSKSLKSFLFFYLFPKTPKTYSCPQLGVTEKIHVFVMSWDLEFSLDTLNVIYSVFIPVYDYIFLRRLCPSTHVASTIET